MSGEKQISEMTPEEIKSEIKRINTRITQPSASGCCGPAEQPEPQPTTTSCCGSNEQSDKNDE